MSSKDAGLDSAKVTLRLRNVLWDLQQHPYPTIPNPPDLKRRASVALIIRINPSYNAWPPKSTAEREISQSDDAGERLNAFFDQDWVKAGTPEVLFIKRASRKGDRWCGHVNIAVILQHSTNFCTGQVMLHFQEDVVIRKTRMI